MGLDQSERALLEEIAQGQKDIVRDQNAIVRRLDDGQTWMLATDSDFVLLAAAVLSLGKAMNINRELLKNMDALEEVVEAKKRKIHQRYREKNPVPYPAEAPTNPANPKPEAPRDTIPSNPGSEPSSVKAIPVPGKLPEPEWDD